MRQQPLASALRQARSDWSARDLQAVQQKLAQVGIGTSEDLARALQNQLNERLREAGLKAFSSETVKALKRCLDVEPVWPAQAEGDAGDAGAEVTEARSHFVQEDPADNPHVEEGPPKVRMEEDRPANVQTREAPARVLPGDLPQSPPSASIAEPPGKGTPSEPRRSEGSALEEEDSEDVVDVMFRAKEHGVSVEKLVRPAQAGDLLKQLDRLDGMSLPELQAACAQHGYPADVRMRSRDLVQQLREALTLEQLVVSALQEACEARGIAVRKVQPRAELLQLLRDARWEALGIPVQRLPSAEVARALLEQVRGLEGLGPEELAAECRRCGLPELPAELRRPSAEKNPEYMVAQLKQAFIWHEMKAPELRRDCRAFGVALDDIDAAGPDGSAQEELLERLIQSLWGSRYEARGVPVERLKSVKLAEDVLKQLDRLHAMGSLSLKAECHKQGLVTNTQMDDALIEERLRDVFIWRLMPQPELQRDCRLLDLPSGIARESLPLRLLRRKDQLRDWEEQGVPVSRFGGNYSKAVELVKEYKSISQMSRKGLEKWFKGTGFPEERDMEKSELELLYKKVRLWEMLPLGELQRECARLPGSSSLATASEDEKERKADMMMALFKHERMLAWERRGFHALRIGSADLAAQIVRQFEHFQGMGEGEFRKLCGDMGLPCGAGEDRGVLSQRVKTLMAWEMMPWAELHKDCVESGLSVQVGRSAAADELRRAEWTQQLVWTAFWGVPVGRLGAAKAANLAGHYQSFDGMSDDELAREYAGRLELPSTPHLERREMLATLRQWTLWLQLPVGHLWSECRERGVPLDGFCLPKPTVHVTAAAPASVDTPAEEALRVQLLPRLFIRERVVEEEREELPTGFAAEGKLPPGRAAAQPPEDGEGGASDEEGFSGVTVDASDLPEVWRYVELIRDPVMCQHVCGVKRRAQPPDVRLPAAARAWPPLEAALYVLSGGTFHPRHHGRDSEPAPAQEDPAALDSTAETPLVSVVCPTCERRQHFHRQLYACFEAQDYERKELVVVDTGARPSPFLQQLASEDPRVIYRFFDVDDLRVGITVRAGKRAWSLGLKRNIACCLARGEAIAHFDDDDVYAPHYLSSMMPRLLRASRSSGDLPAQGLAPAAAKLSEWHLLDLSQMAFHHLDVVTDPSIPQADQRGWIYGWGFSYVFTRTAWELAPIPDVEFAEDLGFIEGLLLRHVPVALVRLPTPRDGLVAHTFHAGSTSGGERLVAAVGTAVGRPSSFGSILAVISRLHAEEEG